MAFAALPPELRSLCRRLTATKAEQLPPLLPSLLKDLIRCQEPLSKPHEAKASESSSESAVLVHKLKTQISALLNSKITQGRFVGVALAKCAIEIGGWECLQTSELWVRGILTILQRKDPVVVKDLCIVTLVKIYTLMHAYPTLVREIVTQTLPTFATACLQILKPPTSSKVAKIPHSLVEHIFEAFSTLVPLYPTTLRQFASKFRTETRPYIAPTISDSAITPISLRISSRRLAIKLHMTAVKGGDSSEWAKHLDGLIKTFHATADQVFRAIQESWESTSGHVPGSMLQQADFDKEPQGGSTNLDQLPPWAGVYAGSERIVALLDFIGEYLRCRTKTAVTIPISAIVDIIARISSILPPSQVGEKSASIHMNPAVGREEKDELWTVFPDIQLAAIKLLHTVARRLGRNFMPVAQESLEQLLRMFESSYRLPDIRTATFLLIKDILQLCGPTMAKLTVESFSLVTKACCRDLLGSAGHLRRPRQSASTAQAGQKNKSISQNVDAFLSNKAEDESIATTLSADHISAAAALLATLFSHVPQQHLPSSLRAQMLRAAILCQNKDAQVASVLHPARDKNGRTPQVILPFLTQQFPHDESVEILRFNFRPMATGSRNDIMDVDDEPTVEDPGDQPLNNGISFNQPFASAFTGSYDFPASMSTKATEAPRSPPPTRATETTVKAPNPFVPRPSSGTAARSEEEHAAAATLQPSPPTIPLKRKNEDADAAAPKRIEIDKAATEVPVASTSKAATFSQAAPAAGSAKGQALDGDDEDSDDESVHLNMDLDSDEEDDDDDDDGEE